MLDSAPCFDAAAAARAASDHFGVRGAAHPLFSERDQNFLIDGGTGTGAVLKIANARESRALLEAQQALLAHLAHALPFTPRVIPARDGGGLVALDAASGARHLAWAITVLPGIPLADVRHPSPALLASFGSAVAKLRAAMDGFDHPAAHRDFKWDLAHARQAVAERRHLVGDADLGAARSACDLPVLRKDFMVDPYQIVEARALGADCVLLIVAALPDAELSQMEDIALGYQMDAILEVHDEAELERALKLKSRLVGVNNRNLKTMKTDLATTERLVKLMPEGRLPISESGIDSPVDAKRMADAGAKAFLIGESLMRRTDVEMATKVLLAGFAAAGAAH